VQLDDRTKELIAVGASVTANCQPCLQYHAGRASEAGAGADEISMAIEVGKTVRRGAASKMDTFAGGLAWGKPARAATPDRDCGCGS
jgi:AhpD family alkylhydroperoxidase